MTKKNLEQLGSLHEIIRRLHNEWVSSKYLEEAGQKLKLVKKVTKNLEEQKRGFLKSKLPYSMAADFLIQNNALLSAEKLLKAIQAILLPKSQ